MWGTAWAYTGRDLYLTRCRLYTNVSYFGNASQLKESFFTRDAAKDDLCCRQISTSFPTRSGAALLDFPYRFALPFPLVKTVATYQRSFRHVRLFAVGAVGHVLREQRWVPRFRNRIALRFNSRFCHTTDVTRRGCVSIVLFVTTQFFSRPFRYVVLFTGDFRVGLRVGEWALCRQR